MAINNMQLLSRASHTEIMDRLSRLLGEAAGDVVVAAVSHYRSGDIQQVLGSYRLRIKVSHNIVAECRLCDAKGTQNPLLGCKIDNYFA
jgi:hypothetical protein